MRRLCAALLASALALAAGSARAAEPAPCRSAHFAELGWTDLALTTGTAALLLRSLGYTAKSDILGLDVTYAALKNGQVDLFLGNWRPVQDEPFKAFFDGGHVEVLATNLVGAKYTLAVPDYVAADGVAGFDDLAPRADAFKRTIYGIEPGSNEYLLDAIRDGRHGLGDWHVVESSEQAMLAEVRRAVARHAPIVFLGWQPHPMNVDLKMTYLRGGDDVFGPDFGGSTVRTIARPGYGAQCPNAARLLRQLTFDVVYENTGMGLVLDDGQTVEAAAAAMARRHPERLDRWLDGVTTFDGGPALPAVRAALARGG